MKNIHLIPNGIFAKKFIDRINKEVSQEENIFLVYRMKNEEDLPETDNIHMIDMKIKNVWKMFFSLLKYDKVFLHNIAYLDLRLMLLLSLVPKFVVKQYWVLWGMDLYYHQKENKSAKEKIVELVRTIFIRNLFGIIFWVKGEYDLACKWYKTRAKYFLGGYCDDKRKLYREILDSKQEKTDDFIRIQVGNSAAPMNNHIEALRKLKEADSPKMLVYSPLSYAGKEDYIKSVIAEGKALFGDRFIPITELMPKNEYARHLGSIDIGVFNTDRQMGLGNISMMLALGKKVYINDYTTSWGYYKGRECHIFALNKVDFSDEKSKNEFFTLLTEEQKESNFEMAQKYIIEFPMLWDKIFKS